jgi:hypothetical protein
MSEGMNINRRFELPDLVIYVGAQTEEAGTRLTAEIEKIVREGKAGTRKGAGFVVSPMPIEYVTDPLRGKSKEQDRELDGFNVFVVVNFRGSKDKARWVAENIHREMAPGKIDVYFRQFYAGWMSLPMTDERAKELAEKELRAQRERIARQAAGPS